MKGNTMPNRSDLVETRLVVAASSPDRAVWVSDIRNVLLSAWCGEPPRHPDYYKALVKVAVAFGINVDSAPTAWSEADPTHPLLNDAKD